MPARPASPGTGGWPGARSATQAEGSWYSGIELHKLWNAEKKADPALAWWAENSKCVYQEAFRDLERALRDFIRSKKGQRKGQRLGFPRFKKRGKCRDSFRFSTGAIGCAGKTVTFRGWARSTPMNPLVSSPAGSRQGRRASCRPRCHGPRSAGSSRSPSRSIVQSRTARTPRLGHRHRPRRESTDDWCQQRRGHDGHPEPEGALRLAAEAAPGVSATHARKRPRSENRRKSAARLGRLHARVANIRANALHKATSGLACRYETVIVENLNVAGMVRNRRLARAVSDQGFGKARRMLDYKTAWNGGRLLTADRWFPSSKTCSGCGTVKVKLPLSERTYRCDSAAWSLPGRERRP